MGLLGMVRISLNSSLSASQRSISRVLDAEEEEDKGLDAKEMGAEANSGGLGRGILGFGGCRREGIEGRAAAANLRLLLHIISLIFFIFYFLCG